MRNMSTIIALLFMLSMVPLAAEQSVRKVTLDECIQIALDNHPDIQKAEESHKKAMADLGVSRAVNRVQINGEVKTIEILKEDASSSELNVPGTDTLIGLFAGVTATYHLIDPKSSKIEDAKKLAVDAARIKMRSTRNNVLLNVKKAYYGYLFARQNENMRSKLLEKFKSKLETARILHKNGQRPILDVSKANLDYGNARLAYLKSRNNTMVMKNELLASMGLVEENIQIIPKLTAGSIDLPGINYSYSELITLGDTYSSDMQLARINKRLTKIQIEVERASRIPVVDILASLGFENRAIMETNKYMDNMQGANWEPTAHFGLKASIPIYNGGAIESRIDGAVADYNQTLYSERGIKIQMHSLIRNYVNTINELQKQVEILELAQDNAEKHLQLATKSYENGVGTQLDLEDAELAVLNAQLNFIQTKSDYYITLAKLANIIGVNEDYISGNKENKK